MTGKPDTYQRILDAGRDLVRARVPVTARTVAAVTQLSTGTVTYYFRRADALVDAVCSEYFASMGELVRCARGSRSDILTSIERAVALSLSNPALVRAITRNETVNRAHAMNQFLGLAETVNTAHGHAVEQKVLALVFMLGVEELAMVDEAVLLRCTGTTSIDAARAVATESIVHAAATLLGTWQRETGA